MLFMDESAVVVGGVKCHLHKNAALSLTGKAMFLKLCTLAILLPLVARTGDAAGMLNRSAERTLTAESVSVFKIPFAEQKQSISLPGDLTDDFRVSKGFLFVRGEYFDTSTTLSWRSDRLRIENPTSSMLVCAEPNVDGLRSPIDSALDLTCSISADTLHITESEMHGIRSTLYSGGIVSLTEDRSPLLVDLSKGGYEEWHCPRGFTGFLQALRSPRGRSA